MRTTARTNTLPSIATALILATGIAVPCLAQSPATPSAPGPSAPGPSAPGQTAPVIPAQPPTAPALPPAVSELEQRFRVVRMDLRGHGGSALAEGAPAPCAMTDLLDDA